MMGDWGKRRDVLTAVQVYPTVHPDLKHNDNNHRMDIRRPRTAPPSTLSQLLQLDEMPYGHGNPTRTSNGCHQGLRERERGEGRRELVQLAGGGKQSRGFCRVGRFFKAQTNWGPGTRLRFVQICNPINITMRMHMNTMKDTQPG